MEEFSLIKLILRLIAKPALLISVLFIIHVLADLSRYSVSVVRFRMNPLLPVWIYLELESFNIYFWKMTITGIDGNIILWHSLDDSDYRRPCSLAFARY